MTELGEKKGKDQRKTNKEEERIKRGNERKKDAERD